MNVKKVMVFLFAVLTMVSIVGCSSDKKDSSSSSKPSAAIVKKIPIDDAPSKETGMLSPAKDVMVELDKKVKPSAAKAVVEVIEEKLQYGKIKKVTYAGLPFYDQSAGSNSYGVQTVRVTFGGKRRGEQYKPEVIKNRNDSKTLFLIETDKYQDLLVEIKKDYSYGDVEYYGKNLYKEKGLIFKDIYKADISNEYLNRNERRKFYEKAISDAKIKFNNFDISKCLDYEMSLYSNVVRFGSKITVVLYTYPEKIKVSQYDSRVVWDAFLLSYDSSGKLLDAKYQKSTEN